MLVITLWYNYNIIPGLISFKESSNEFFVSLDLVCFEEPELTMWEWVMSKAYNLIYGWECSPGWMRFAGILELFILDPFVDLFITLCIITNTIFMAMDHAGIQPELSNILNIGNTVSSIQWL